MLTVAEDAKGPRTASQVLCKKLALLGLLATTVAEESVGVVSAVKNDDSQVALLGTAEALLPIH